MIRTLKTITALSSLLVALFCAGCSKEKQISTKLKKAESYYLAEDFNAARISYLDILADDPKNSVALARLGSIWMKRGSSIQALPYLLSTRKAAPEDFDSRIQLARVLYSTGHRRDSLQEIRSILDGNPKHDETLHFYSQIAETPDELADLKQRHLGLAETNPHRYHLYLATLASKSNDAKTAEAELRNALAIDPENHLSQLGLARILSFQGDHAKALEAFEKATSLSPRYSKQRLAQAEYFLKRGEPEKAKTFLQGIVDDTADLIPAQTLLARLLAQEESYEEALAITDKILGIDSIHLETLGLKGKLLRTLGKNQEALDFLISAIDHELYRNSPKLHEEIAQAHLALDNKQDAIPSLKKAIAGQSSPPIELQLLLATTQLQQDEPSTAQVGLEQILERHPKNRRATALLGECLQAQGERTSAILLFESLLRNDETDVLPHIRLASLYRQDGKLAEARKHYLSALKLTPKNITIHGQLLELDLLAKDYSSAHSKADQLLSSAPDLPQIHYLKARIHHAEKDWPLAIAELKKCRDLGTTHNDVALLLISCYLENKQRDLALDEVLKLLPTVSNNTRSLFALALYLEALGEHKRAAETHERVLALRPDTIPSLNNLAVIYTDHLPKLERARELAEKAVTLNSHNPTIADTLGWILYHHGEYAQALTQIQKASVSLTDNLEVQHHLGLAAYAMAQPKIAIPAFSRCITEKEELSSSLKPLLALITDLQTASPAHNSSELQARLNKSPDDLVAILLLSRIQQSEGKTDLAEKNLLHALELRPESILTLKALLHLYLDSTEKLALALPHAQKARSLDDEDPEIAMLFGRIILEQGNHAQAYSLLYESSQKQQPTADLSYDFARASYYVGKIREARTLMQSVLSANPRKELETEAQLFLSLTTAIDDNERLLELAPTIKQRLTKKPSDLPALFAHARHSLLSKNNNEAEDTLRKILKQAPAFSPATKELAILLSQKEDHLEEASALATKARISAPDDLDLTRALALISFRKKNYSYSVQLYEQSARAQELDALSRYYLGLAYQKTGNSTEARTNLEQALSQGLPETESALATEALQSFR